MDTLAPPVVAVVVSHDPGPWFEETLTSLASQDYAELSVLVLDSASSEDLTARVAAILPTAYVRRLEENRGFGAAVNEVQAMVDGAAYFLVCHDDVALFPDAVHLMVEEAFRSNAGVVSPKVVSWDDPERLIHVGMTVDKGGSVVERVQPGEIDHGQHDAVRDVFVAPGGCNLIRADLFGELGGFDTAIVAMGEDLDLCWRAQVVGARIIVAPDARVRHLEELAGGHRALEPSLVSADGDQPATHPVTLQELQRRHELLAVFKCYGRFHLFRVVPQVFVLALGEVIVAELAGNRARARAVVRAWRWNLGRLGVIRRQRQELNGHRRLGDKEIRLFQIGGSARLSAYGRRVFQHGFHGAHADELAAADDGAPGPPAAAAVAAAVGVGDGAGGSTAAVGPAGAGGTVDGAVRPEAGRVAARTRLTTWLIAAAIVVIGSRGILGSRLPVVGQFVPFPGWSQTWAQFFSAWHPSGVGTTAPASPALALAGVVGTVLFGAMGLTQKVLIYGCLPLGVWGTVRLLRPFGSQRASLIGGLAYLAMALPYNALALGRWGALVLYAGAPWMLVRLFRATGDRPFVTTGSESGVGTTVRGIVALGLVEAVLVSFVPAAAVAVVLAALALVLPSAVAGDWRVVRRVLGLALGATAVAALICLPWVIGVLSAGRGAVAVFGVPIPASEAASWSSLLRFAAGPIGVSPLAWGFAVAALVPLVLARQERFRWAGRFWSVALVFWIADWVIGRGWIGSLAIDPLVLLAPAAVAVAAAIGLGVAAFEEDLRAADFGWRQLVTVVATGAVILGSIPTLMATASGRWDLPMNDFAQSVAWMGTKTADGAFRVLWLGDSRALNQGSWAAGDGLAYATSEDGSPDARWLWSAAGPGPASEFATAVNLARTDRTDRLGQLLAPAAIRYVVVLTSLAPEIGGEQNPTDYPVPADLLPGLAQQLDLSPVISGTGITVYANAAWIPQRAEVAAVPVRVRTAPRAHTTRAHTTPAHTTPARTTPARTTPARTTPALIVPPVAGAFPTPGAPLVAGTTPVLPGPVAAGSYHGPLAVGTLLTASAPAGRWALEEADGTTVPPSPSFGWAGSYRVTAAGVATLHFDGGWIAPVSLLVSLVVWLGAVAVVASRRLGGSWRRIRTGRRRPLTDGSEPGGDPTGPGAPDRSEGTPVGVST